MKLKVAIVTIQFSANYLGEDGVMAFDDLQEEIMNKVEWLKDKQYSISCETEEVEL